MGYSELDSVGFLNVDNRVKQLRLNHVFKIFNGTSPSYLLDHFHKVSESHRYNTTDSSENFVVPRVSSQASTTFFFNGIKDWSGLHSEIKRDGNFNMLKTLVKRYLNSQMQLMENDIFCYYKIGLHLKVCKWSSISSLFFPHYLEFKQ